MINGKMRTSWASSIINQDWPSASTFTIKHDAERIKRQKEELTGILDDIGAININTMIYQVVSCSDALYPSDLLPWPRYLNIFQRYPAISPVNIVGHSDIHGAGNQSRCYMEKLQVAAALGNNMMIIQTQLLWLCLSLKASCRIMILKIMTRTLPVQHPQWQCLC